MASIMEHLKKQIEENKKGVQLAIGGIVITLGVGSVIWMGTRENAYSVIVNGEVVAVVKTKEEVKKAYEQVVTSLKEELGVDIAVNEKIELEAIHSKQSELSQYEALVEGLDQAISYQVEAYEILVDGESYAIVSTSDEANHVLEDIAKSYLPTVDQLTLCQAEVKTGESTDQEIKLLEEQGEGSVEVVQIEEALPQEEVSNVVHVDSFEVQPEEASVEAGQKIRRSVESFDFNEEVIVRNVYVNQDTILDEAQAEEELLQAKHEIVDYALVEGDNVWDLAMQYDTTPERIMELNPDIEDQTTMQIGQVIKLEKASPILSITTVEEATFKQLIPAEIQYVEFSHLYAGETQVYQEGSDGLKEITVAVTKVNGEEVSREAISEKVLSEPVIKVIGYGVKEKPAEDVVVKSNGSSNLIHPLKGAGYISSTYGSRWGGFHKGIDFAASSGTPIYASAGGKVIYSGYNSGGYGNLVIIEHSDGYQTYYAHCSRLYVNVGDSVSQGERIAGVGTTGDSTGNHLHFEVRRNGTPVNPSNYL
ncbi:MAG: M23 family metallopeptidase [Cellulosilyticum sp.]|nr:M23 family metallopeptidase [Cellulosilyticum sp.]